MVGNITEKYTFCLFSILYIFYFIYFVFSKLLRISIWKISSVFRKYIICTTMFDIVVFFGYHVSSDGSARDENSLYGQSIRVIVLAVDNSQLYKSLIFNKN